MGADYRIRIIGRRKRVRKMKETVNVSDYAHIIVDAFPKGILLLSLIHI